MTKNRNIFKSFKKFTNSLLILFSSFLLFLSYPKISLWILAWVSLIPAVLVLYKLKKMKEVIFYGFLFGFSFYVMLLYWIIPTLQAGKVNLWLAILALILLSIVLSFEFIVLFVFSFKFKRFSPIAFALIFSSIWVMLEYCKINISKFVPSFPWFSISYTQWNNTQILPYAYYGGIYLISFMIVFFQSLFIGIVYRWKNLKKGIVSFFLISSIIFFIHLFSLKIKQNSVISQEKFSIAILQPSIDLYKKWDKTYEGWIKKRIEKLIELAYLDNPNLIIWPENALPGWIDDKEIYEWLKKNIHQTNTYHIVGSISQIDGKFVSAYLINPDGEIISGYNKRILVPFGEYVPFRNILGKYVKVVSTLGEFEKGNSNQNLFEVKNFKIGPSICYETMFNYLFNDQAKKGADFFVNITNDGWYLNTGAPYQHLAAAVLRAAENGKYFIRAANNGVSAVISPYGEIEKKLELNDYGIIKAEISKTILQERTFPFSNDCVFFLSLIIIVSFFFAVLFL